MTDYYFYLLGVVIAWLGIGLICVSLEWLIVKIGRWIKGVKV